VRSAPKRRRKSANFDANGRKIPSQHSPLYEAGRVAGPPGTRRPRWFDSVTAAWNRYEKRDAMRRWRDNEIVARPLVVPASAPAKAA
jgi:hypothetical protein